MWKLWLLDLFCVEYWMRQVRLFRHCMKYIFTGKYLWLDMKFQKKTVFSTISRTIYIKSYGLNSNIQEHFLKTWFTCNLGPISEYCKRINFHWDLISRFWCLEHFHWVLNSLIWLGNNRFYCNFTYSLCFNLVDFTISENSEIKSQWKFNAFTVFQTTLACWQRKDMCALLNFLFKVLNGILYLQ